MNVEYDWSTHPFVYPPRDYQAPVIQDTWDKPYWAYFAWPRTGKCKITLDTIVANYRVGRIGGAVIIAKVGEYQNWPVIEIPKHWPPGIPYHAAVWKSAMGYKAEGEMRAALMDGASEFKFLVVNVEAVLWRRVRGKPVPSRALQVIKDFIDYMGEVGFMLVVDESTCVKNHDSGRSQAVYSLRPYAKMKRILTGTPITESPLHVWGQSKVLGESILGAPNYTTFRAEFAEMEKVYVAQNTTIDVVAGYKNLGELDRRVRKWATVIGPEVLKLIPPTRQILPAVMDDQQQRYYNQLVNMAIVELESGPTVTVANKMAIMGKLHQIVCGHLKDKTETHKFSDTRIEVLQAFLEPRKHKCIIWCNYRASVEMVFEALVKEYGPDAVDRVYGGTRNAMEVVQRYQDPNDPLRLIVANQLSLGYGQTLDQCRTHIYFANNWSGEQRVQSEQRGNNPANPWSIEIADIVTPGTVDQRYYQVLQRKSNLLSDFFSGKMSLHDMLMPDPKELVQLGEGPTFAQGSFDEGLLALMEKDLAQSPQE